MRINRIVAFDISHTHPGHKSYDTDSYYVKLANRLLDSFDKAHLDLGDATPNIMRYAAISLASYMEDVVADSITAVNTGNALFIRLGQRHGERKGIVRRIRISNLVAQVPF